MLLRNLIFTILQPGLVCGLLPWWIAGEKFKQVVAGSWGWAQYVGMVLVLPGLCILFFCIYQFAIQGRGTLSPLDPTKRLVIKGLYRYTRNPMYVGVLLILIGETVFTWCLSIVGYTVMVGLAFNLFIILVEEPRLERDFGEDYRKYTKSVRRWV